MPYKKYGKKTSSKRVPRRTYKNSFALGTRNQGAVRAQYGGAKRQGYQRGGLDYITGKLMSNATFPQSMYMEHKYLDVLYRLNETITGSIGSEYNFRLNSLFDPDFTSSGHQPTFFDQMTAIYAKYAVYAVRINIRIVDANEEHAALVVCVKSSGGSSAPIASLPVAIAAEKPGIMVIDSKPGRGGCWDSGWMSISDLEGASRAMIMGDISYSGTAGGNPTTGPYLVLGVGNWASATGTAMRFVVEINYKAKWYAPVTAAQS